MNIKQQGNSGDMADTLPQMHGKATETVLTAHLQHSNEDCIRKGHIAHMPASYH